MRPDTATPALAALDLLARADALAAAANHAIAAGDEAALDALLEERGVVIMAAIAACEAAMAEHASEAMREELATATRGAVAGNDVVRSTAERARHEVVTELAALDARQQASQEYQPVAAHGRIDVVL